MKLIFPRQRQFARRISLLAMVLTLLGFALPRQAEAQSNCTYSVEMSSSFGIGWLGAFLTVVSDGEVSFHTFDIGGTAVSTFEVTQGTEISWYFTPSPFQLGQESYRILDAGGNVIFTSGNPPAAGTVNRRIACCSSSCATPPGSVSITQVTDSSASLNWLSVGNAAGYIIEYGPTGYAFGAGLTIDSTTSEADLSGLNPCVTYDVYITTICNSGLLSCAVGPLTFTTDYTPAVVGPTCNYTLEMFDAASDGWDNGVLTFESNGTSLDFTLADDSFGIATIPLTGNFPVTVSYSAGFFDFEVSYNLLDPNGNLIFSDGFPPTTGEAFTFIACPTCPGPTVSWMSDINATNAEVSWLPENGAAGNYVIEYGPLGFTLGTGIVLTVSDDVFSATLTGLQENSWYDVYVKLDCGLEDSKNAGPVTFQTIWLNDVGVSAIFNPNLETACDLNGNDSVTIALHNFGQVPQTLFEFYYAVNGVPVGIPVPQDGLFTGVVGNDSSQVISFETTYDFSEPGLYVIEAWTSLEGDSDPSNDTFRLELITAWPKPLQEDFEDNELHPEWSFSGLNARIYSPFEHENPTYVFSDLMGSFNLSTDLVTYRIFPIEADDTLSFDYRFVDNFFPFPGTDLLPGNTLQVQISTNCGDTYQTILTINSANHVTSSDLATRKIPLTAYAGQDAIFRFRTSWAAGEYWVDIDNINIAGCPGSLGLLAEITSSLPNEPTGSIDVNPVFGQGPYTYLWSNGASSEVITDLPSGVYVVTVTDVNGCSDSKTFDVGIFVDADETSQNAMFTLYPNPANGVARLDVALAHEAEMKVRLVNTNGQVVFESKENSAIRGSFTLDVSQQPPGLYLVQLIVEGKAYYSKLVVTR